MEISRDVDGRFFDMSYPVLDYVRENSEELSDIAVVSLRPVALGVEEGADVVMAYSVTDRYFPLLQQTPASGRFFTEDEARFPRVRPVAVISHRFWTRRMESDSGAVGSTIRVNGLPVAVIGIARPGFGGHSVGLTADLWVPVGLPASGLHSARSLEGPQDGILAAIGVLSPGSSVGPAESELGALATAFLEGRLDSRMEQPYQTRVDPWAPVPSIIRTGVFAFLSVLTVLVALVLAMACLNVSGMLLSRIHERGPELAIRQVLGAGKRRVIGQLLTESLLLYGMGALGGILLTVWATRLLLAFKPPVPIPGFDIQLDLGVDWRVLAFAVGVALLTGVLFSLTPVLRGAEGALASDLRGAGRGGSQRRSSLRSFLVAAQMGTTVILLVGAGLFVRALDSLESMDTGWDTTGVTVADFDLELSGYSTTDAPDFFERLRDRVHSLPGVEAAGLAAKLPLGGRSGMGDVQVFGVEPPPGRSGFEAYTNTVTAGYFDAVGLQLSAGRDFSPADQPTGERVAIINQAMADRLWPAASPVGNQFSIGDRSFTVVGVVETAKYNRLVEDPFNFYYLPFSQRASPQMVLHVRASESVDAMVPAIRNVVAQLDDNLPILPIRSLDEALEVFFLPQRLAAAVAGVMGALALLLGSVGVYGITAFMVGQRRREIGIRLALGASRASVIRAMMRRGLIAPLVGMTIGLAAAVAVTRFLRTFLAEVSPLDPLTFGIVLAGLATVAALAVFVPTKSASAVDPATTLRAD